MTPLLSSIFILGATADSQKLAKQAVYSLHRGDIARAEQQLKETGGYSHTHAHSFLLRTHACVASVAPGSKQQILAPVAVHTNAAASSPSTCFDPNDYVRIVCPSHPITCRLDIAPCRGCGG